MVLLAGAAAEPALAAGPASPVPWGPPDGPWVLEFEDTFDGDALDPAKWANGFGWGQVANRTYGFCDPAHNIVRNGMLEQRIRQRPKGDRPFRVGCINSRDRFYQLYGFWEARIRAAGCRGARSAFWAKPNDESWPPELDVVEVYGDRREEADLTIHWQDRRGVKQRDKTRIQGPDYTADFHVFGAEWTPSEVIWYVDGVEQKRTRQGYRFMNDGGPFYMMLEAQVIRSSSRCGQWSYYSSQYVDYVRVWRRPG